MKVTIDENEKKSSAKYPFIGKSTKSNLIALFTEPGKGIVLEPGENAMWLKGEYCEDIFMDNFVPFKGIIELTND